MSWIAKDLPTLVFALLPGFITAGIFFSLTAHPKSSEFERVIQALIFTSLLKFITIILKIGFLVFGRTFTLGTWTSDIEFAWSLVFSIPLGLSFVWFTNNDLLHRLMRKWKVSTRTSFPSEWYGTFASRARWVILHLADGRRLYGWPEEWPDQPDKGHFVIDQPEWLLDNNDRAPLYRVERFMIPAVDVKMVEFLKENEEILEDSNELKRAEQLLLSAQAKKEKPDGSKSATAGPEPAADE